jgi:hypothetical protein
VRAGLVRAAGAPGGKRTDCMPVGRRSTAQRRGRSFVRSRLWSKTRCSFAGGAGSVEGAVPAPDRQSRGSLVVSTAGPRVPRGRGRGGAIAGSSHINALISNIEACAMAGVRARTRMPCRAGQPPEPKAGSIQRGATPNNVRTLSDTPLAVARPTARRRPGVRTRAKGDRSRIRPDFT